MARLTPFCTAPQLLQRNPTLIARVGGVAFYEHPVHGDEAGLLAVCRGHVWPTEFYDTPTLQEVQDWIVDAIV